MQVIKKLFDFYLNSSIHVALAVYALSWITLLEFDLPYDENVLYFIFYATITGYNFVKYFGVAKFHHRRLATWLKIIQIFSLLCFLLLCYYAYHLEQTTLIYLAVFGLVTFFYAIPFLPRSLLIDSNQNLRSISGLKIYIIALVWAGVTVFIPLLNNKYNIDLDVVLTAVQRFILVIVLMLPFEIRDMRYDSVKLSTIPQRIGVKQTKIIGVLLLLAFFFLEYFKNVIDAERLICLLIVTITTVMLLLFSKENQNKYYSAFWVESLPIWWLVILLVFS